MHELSVALSMVDLAEKEVQRAEASEVTEIELEIGRFSGVEMDAFDFAWPMAVKDTVLAHAKRRVIRIEGRSHCPECDSHFESQHFFDPCPECGNPFCVVEAGKELKIKSLTVN